MRRVSAALMIMVLILGFASLAHAQTDQRCFSETNQCISGRFRAYWEQNGGLAVFGFPISSAGEVANRWSGQTYLTQWFERNRFEFHPENNPPYDVLLGRVSEERLWLMGVVWQTLPREPGPKAGCLWFEQTGHNLCDQGSEHGFKTFWLTHGLADARLNRFARSLALFGFPLTEATMQVSPYNGQVYLIQWFERARFERHPAEPDQYKVLLGLIGNELRLNSPDQLLQDTNTPLPHGSAPRRSRARQAVAEDTQ